MGKRTKSLGYVRANMKNFYAEINGITITFGDIQDDGLIEKLPFYCERDSGKEDFDFAEGFLPTAYITKSYGFSNIELTKIRTLMRINSKLIYDKAKGQGVWA